MNRQELKIVCVQYWCTYMPEYGKTYKARITFKEPFAGQFVYRMHHRIIFQPMAVWRLKKLKEPVAGKVHPQVDRLKILMEIARSLTDSLTLSLLR